MKVTCPSFVWAPIPLAHPYEMVRPLSAIPHQVYGTRPEPNTNPTPRMMNSEPHDAESEGQPSGTACSNHEPIPGTDRVEPITVCAGKPVIAFAAWRQAQTDEQRADLYEALTRRLARDAGVDHQAFARGWLADNSEPRPGNVAAVVTPTIAAILAQRFSTTAQQGHEAACLTQ